MPTPDLDLDLKPRAAARPKPRKEAVEEAPLELAIDPRSLMEQRASETSAPSASSSRPRVGHAASPASASAGAGGAPLVSARPSYGALSRPSAPPPGDLEADAVALADYGDKPASPVLSPVYAWRVFKRQRELRTALAVRRAEAAHAQAALDDALVAFAERTRPVAQTLEAGKGYLAPLDEVTRAEEQLRSRDKVLAAEQDAQRERLAQVDGRIAKAEHDVAQAQGRERAVATELAGIQGALAREEAHIKRAEAELKAAQQREGASVPR